MKSMVTIKQADNGSFFCEYSNWEGDGIDHADATFDTIEQALTFAYDKYKPIKSDAEPFQWSHKRQESA